MNIFALMRLGYFFCLILSIFCQFSQLNSQNIIEQSIYQTSIQNKSKSEDEVYQKFRKSLIIKSGQSHSVQNKSNACSSSTFQNIGFELGNFSGWNLERGTILNSMYDSIVNLVPITTTNNIVYTNNGNFDAFTGMPFQSPFSGSCAVVLNDKINNLEATQLSTKFRVSPSNNILKTAFATVLEKSYHECEGQPYFRIQVFNCSRNALIEEFLMMGNESKYCSGSNITLFNDNSSTSSLSNFNFSSWKKVCFDLRNYIGEVVEVNVIVADCKYTGHYGYAYFDAEFGSLPSSYTITSTFSVNSTSYTFNTGLNNQCFAGGSLLQCSNASSIYFPNANGTYSTTIGVGNSMNFSIPGYYNIVITATTGCDFLNELYIPVNPSVTISAPNTTLCPNSPYTYTISGARDYTVKINGVQSQTLHVPNINITPINLNLTQNASTVTLIGSNGPINCLDSASIVLQVYPQTTLTTIYSPTVCAGTTTVSASGALTYTWNTSAANTSSWVTSVGANNHFNVIGTDFMGCRTALSSFSIQGLFSSSISYSVPFLSSICEGDSVLCNFIGATNFTWSNGFNGASQFLKPTIAIPFYTVSASAPCTSTQTFSINYFVFSGPAANTFTVNHPNGPLCPGTSFSVQGLGSNFYFKYGTTGAFTNVGTYNVNPSIINFTAVAQSTNGCGTTSLIPISYLPSPSLAISGNTTICAGQIGSFTATGANSYTWDYSQAGNTYTTLPSNTNYSLVLTAQGLNGCFSHSVFPIQVENMLITASSNSANLCIGSNTVTLNAHPFLSGGTYSWSTGAASQSISVSPTVSTVYTLITNSSLCGIKTTTLSLSVNPNTVTPISVSISPVCLGKAYTVTASGASIYQFSYFAPTTSNTFTAIPTYTQTQYFSVIGTASNGCVTSSNFSFAPAQAVSLITPSVVNFAKCLNSPVTLTISGANSYTWSNGATGSLITVSPPVTTGYTVVGTSVNGCMTNTLGMIVTIVNPPTITISPSSLTVCPNSWFTINASAGSGYVISQWSDGTIGAQLTSSINVPTTFTVNMSNNICNVSQTIQVNLFNPSALILNNSGFCSGVPNTISYTATPPGGTLFINGVQGNTFNTYAAGIFTVAYNYQDTGMCVLSSQSLITINPSPCVKLVADKYLVCEGNAITFNASPLGGLYFGTNAAFNVLSPAVAGTYSVSYTYSDVNGCTETACIEVQAEVCLGLKEENLNKVRIFPNPTEELVTIEKSNQEKVELFVYDINGRLIFRQNLQEESNIINMRDFSKGIYIFQLQDESNRRSLKVIKN